MTRAVPVEGFAPVVAAGLVGTWHIVQTNFPMWLTGAKTDPTLNYGASDQPTRLEDVVRYTAGGRQKEIRGVDVQDPANLAHFTWRGRGLLALVTSDWYVVHNDRDAGILAIYFTSTLFTPAGMDIASRSPCPADTAVATARAAAAAIPGLAGEVSKLVTLRRRHEPLGPR